MDPATVPYVRAALVLVVAVVAFVLVTIKAWPANRYLAGLFAAWARGLPERRRRARDPEYRRRQERVEEYLGAFGGLIALRRERDRLTRARDEARTRGVFGVADRLVEDADARCAGMEFVAVEIMRRLDADAVAAIADRLNADCFGGALPAADLRAFLEEERTLILASPHLAADHAGRLARRFGQAPAPLAKADPKV